MSGGNPIPHWLVRIFGTVRAETITEEILESNFGDLFTEMSSFQADSSNFEKSENYWKQSLIPDRVYPVMKAVTL